MKQFYGSSVNGSVNDALKGLESPKLIILIAQSSEFENSVEELEKAFPGVPSIGCVAMSYKDNVNESAKGVGVIAFCGDLSIDTNVIEDVNNMPAKYIKRIQNSIDKVKPGKENTVCIDFCTGNDACVLTTINRKLDDNNVTLMGGTSCDNKVSVNGVVYKDAMVYALVKNNTGKAKAYKENIYIQKPGYRMVASDTDKKNYYVGKLNGKPAKQMYMEACGITESEFASQIFKNPLGKFNGKDICIISIKEPKGAGFVCYRQINDSDVLALLELKDWKAVVEETKRRINSDFSKVSAVFSVNCIFRKLLFGEMGEMNNYLATMSKLGNHCGFVGNGEHYNEQFINQSMTCVVFE